MLSLLATKIARHFFDDNDKYPMELYVYGIELIISTIISTALIILTGVITNSFIESIIFLFSFSVIRVYTGGYHSMTYLVCNVVSVLSYVFIYLSLEYAGAYFSNVFVMCAGYVLTMVLALLFAPVENKNKELTKQEKKKYKLLSLVMITVFYSVSAVCYYIFGIAETLVIFPTCIVIDGAMLVSVINNHYTLRRVSK